MVLTEHKKGRVKEEQTDFHEGQKVALLISNRTKMGFIAARSWVNAFSDGCYTESIAIS